MPETVRPLDDDIIQTFQIESSNLRGRIVRLGSTLDEILTRHAYPEPVARLLGETIVLATALAGMLKYEGIFTLQTKGDGPIRLMVADVTSTGDIRGYAQFDEDRLASAGTGAGAVPSLLGSGYLAFTVDQGENTERYQGIVELTGDELTDSIQHYFRQSEQLATGLQVAVRHDAGDRAGGWHGGSLLVQRMPEEGGEPVPSSDTEDDWRRAMVLMSTLTPEEMTDTGLPVNDLLYRLFHEEGVRVWPPSPVRAGCRCSRERVETVLRSLPRAELDELKVEDEVRVTCEFCSTTYGFGDADLDRLNEG